MKKVKLLIVAMCVVAMAATGALAATLTVTAPDGGTKTDYRLLAAADYRIGPASGVVGQVVNTKVEYTANVPLVGPAFMNFTLTNAKFVQGQQLFLHRLNADGTFNENIGSTTAALAADTATITINVANGEVLNASEKFALAAAIGANTMFDVKLTKGLAADSTATIAVTSVLNQLSQPVADATAAAVNLYATANGLGITKTNDAADIIDVNNGRKTFVGDIATSAVNIDLITNANGVVNQVDPTSASDTWHLTIKGSLQGVKTVQTGTVAAHTITDAERAAGEVALSGAGNAPNWTANPALTFALFDAADRVALETRSFTYTFDDNATPVVTDAALVTWGINGAQFYVQTLKTTFGNQGWTSVLISNTSAIAGAVEVDVIGSDGATATVALGTIEAGNVLLLQRGNIKNLVEAAGVESDSISGLFTVNVPQESCFVDAWSGVNQSKSGVPVLTPANNGTIAGGAFTGTGAWK